MARAIITNAFKIVYNDSGEFDSSDVVLGEKSIEISDYHRNTLDIYDNPLFVLVYDGIKWVAKSYPNVSDSPCSETIVTTVSLMGYRTASICNIPICSVEVL